MTTILAIDTATENCSAALLHNGQYYIQQSVAPQQHTKLILPMIDKLINDANITKKDINYIAYGHGPGSFTGVRIAASCALGLALGLDLKVQGVSNLKALAYRAYELANKNEALYVASIDARMSEIYLGLFTISKDGLLEPLIDECVLDYQKAVEKIDAIGSKYKTIIGAGTGCKLLKSLNLSDFSEIIVDFPDACSIIKLANMCQDNFVDANDAQPVYIRNEVTWKKISSQ